MDLGPGTLIYQEIQTSYSLFEAYHLVWNYLSPSKINVRSFILLTHVQFSSGPAPAFRISLKSFYQGMKRVHEAAALCYLLVASQGRHNTRLELLLICLFAALLHPVLDCVVSSSEDFEFYSWADIVMPFAFLRIFFGVLPWPWIRYVVLCSTRSHVESCLR